MWNMKASNAPPINYIPKISMEKLLQTASTLRVFTERVCVFFLSMKETSVEYGFYRKNSTVETGKQQLYN